MYVQLYLSRMQSACAVLSSVACSAVPYFTTLTNKSHDLREKFIECNVCVLFFSAAFV